MSINKIILIFVSFIILFFTVIKPSIIRGVCYNEAKRRDLFDYFASPDSTRQNKNDQKDNVNKLYIECKTYNAGKVWEQIFFNDLRL